jgi:hypothetical protein
LHGKVLGQSHLLQSTVQETATTVLATRLAKMISAAAW